jgi:hypothetical protein
VPVRAHRPPPPPPLAQTHTLILTHTPRLVPTRLDLSLRDAGGVTAADVPGAPEALRAEFVSRADAQAAVEGEEGEP